MPFKFMLLIRSPKQQFKFPSLVAFSVFMLKLELMKSIKSLVFYVHFSLFLHFFFFHQLLVPIIFITSIDVTVIMIKFLVSEFITFINKLINNKFLDFSFFVFFFNIVFQSDENFLIIQLPFQYCVQFLK